MNIDFTYAITSVNHATKTMMVSYSATNYPTVSKEVRIPWREEDLDIVLREYAPYGVWWAYNKPTKDIVVGTKGLINSQNKPAVKVIPQTDVNTVKAEQISKIAQSRYLYETSGININGTRFKTDRESQAAITSAFISLSQGLLTTVDWKTEPSVWITLDLQKITDVYNAVMTKVQLGHTTEKELVTSINNVDAKLDNAIKLIEDIVWPQ